MIHALEEQTIVPRHGLLKQVREGQDCNSQQKFRYACKSISPLSREKRIIALGDHHQRLFTWLYMTDLGSAEVGCTKDGPFILH